MYLMCISKFLHVVICACLHIVYNCIFDVYFTILHVVICVYLHSVYNGIFDVYFMILRGVI